MRKNEVYIIDYIKSLHKNKQALKKAKCDFKKCLESKKILNNEEFKKEYPYCDYSIDDLKFAIKFINFTLKDI